MSGLFPEITLEELEAMAIETILKAKERFKPVATFALFSGGNDSTAMLHLVKDHVDAAVHVVTGIGIPAARVFVNKVCERSHLADYRLKHGVPQSDVAALIHKSGECLCGAFAKLGELEEIEFWFPETGAYIRSLEREAEKQGKPYCRWGWGHDKRAGVASPGPLCSSCELFDGVQIGTDRLEDGK